MRKLTPEEVEENIKGVEAWFATHPRKRRCKVGDEDTTLFVARRGHIREDIEIHGEEKDASA